MWDAYVCGNRFASSSSRRQLLLLFILFVVILNRKIYIDFIGYGTVPTLSCLAFDVGLSVTSNHPNNVKQSRVKEPETIVNIYESYFWLENH